jgi:hypothetical protein
MSFSGVDGGVRAVGELRSLFLKAGIDYSFAREDASFLLSLTLPLRRGGLLGRGTTLRVDWLPGRGNSWSFGIQVPLEPHMGRTRPRDTEVDMPRAAAPKNRATLPPDVEAALAGVRSSARGIAVLSSPFWPDSREDEATALTKTKERILAFQRIIESTDPRPPRGVTMYGEVRILHEDLDRAFAVASGAPEKGALLGDLARQTALDAVDAARRNAVAAVFSEYLAILEDTRAWWVKQIESDSRLAWLPFPLARRPPRSSAATPSCTSPASSSRSSSSARSGPPRTITSSGSTTTTASTTRGCPTSSGTTSPSGATSTRSPSASTRSTGPGACPPT